MAVDLCVETKTVMDAVEDVANANVNHLKKHGYYQEWKRKRLELEDGTLYRYEASVQRSLRQVRARVVPRIFRRIILAACHASPFAGHCSETKTLWRVLSKYWWPSVVKDAREGVR